MRNFLFSMVYFTPTLALFALSFGFGTSDAPLIVQATFTVLGLATFTAQIIHARQSTFLEKKLTH